MVEDFAGGEFGDRGVVDEEPNSFACVFGPDAEVMHFPSPTQ